MPAFRSLIGLFVLVLMLGACSTRSGTLEYNRGDFRPPDAMPSALGNPQYKLSPGDVVTVRVYELDSVSGDQQVDATGRINFPLVGLVEADGKTTEEFSTALATKLGERYLQSPHVVVTLKTAAARIVTVDGAVESPGMYQVTPNTTTLIQAIALARGPTNRANLKRVIVFRQIDGARQAAGFDLTTIRRGVDPDPILYPNDLVVVDGSNVSDSYRTLLRSIPLAGLFLRL